MDIITSIILTHFRYVDMQHLTGFCNFFRDLIVCLYHTKINRSVELAQSGAICDNEGFLI